MAVKRLEKVCFYPSSLSFHKKAHPNLPLLQERRECERDPPLNCSAGLRGEGESLYEWEATIMGPVRQLFLIHLFWSPR